MHLFTVSNSRTIKHILPQTKKLSPTCQINVQVSLNLHRSGQKTRHNLGQILLDFVTVILLGAI